MANVTRDFRPNLYLAIADDWGYATSYTGQNLSTPAFDALAQDGVIFTRAFTAAPTCTPARNALLFSRWPWRLGAASKMWEQRISSSSKGLPLKHHFPPRPEFLE